jgi:hypothetical protein
MIIAFKKGLKFIGTAGTDQSVNPSQISKDNLFPIINIPMDLEGEELSLNDFQWWTYTDKWKKWLESNPRSWQAESAENIYKKSQALLEKSSRTSNIFYDYAEDQVYNLIERKKVISFSEYVRLNEEESEEDSPNKEFLAKFQKLTFAVQKLINEGKLKTELTVDEDFPEGDPQAVIVDFLDEAGNPVYSSRSALRITRKYDVGNLILCEFDYAIPTGEVKETESLLDDISKYVADVALGLGAIGGIYLALTAVGGIYSTWLLAKTARNIYSFGNSAVVRSLAPASSRVGGLAGLKAFGSRLASRAGLSGLLNAGKVVLPSGAFVKGGAAYASNGALLRGAAATSVKQAAQRLVASGGARAASIFGARAAAGGAAGATVAAEASNPIGWILLAVQVVGSGINQTWNWLSDKQAPKFSEVDDFAYGSFKPKNIPVGRSITVCWTSDGGASGWDVVIDVLSMSKNDTRTTMELVKIGQKENRSIFILLQVNSKMLQNVVEDNNLVLLSFDNDSEFSRGFADNDDLELRILAIPNIEDYMLSTSLVGFCDWDLLQDEYSKAPDYPLTVPKDASEDYVFYYTNESGEVVNVKGSLLSESQIKDLPLDNIFPVIDEKSNESLTIDNKEERISKNRALSFDEFSLLAEKEEDAGNEKEEEKTRGEEAEGQREEDQKGEEKKEEDPDQETEDNQETEDDKKWAQGLPEPETDPEKSPASSSNEYGQIPVIVYKVVEKEYANPEILENPGDFNYFVVDNSSMSPSEGDPIRVEVTSDDKVKNPRYGIFEYKEEEKEEEQQEEPEEKIEIEDVEDKEDTGDGGDLSLKSRKNASIIRDTKPREGINPLEQFGTEELKNNLAISDWENVTYAKIRYDRFDQPTEVILRNKLSRVGDRKRVVKRGELGFEEAVKFVNDIESSIKSSR